MIDLRSDTVTRPSQAMRQAMVDAAVGDDVYGEDPTVIELQDMAAELLGKEAALFVPSGTMANQIAIKIHTQPCDEILVGKDAHNWLFETGGAAVISGVQIAVLPGDGRFSSSEVEVAHKGDDHHRPPTRMVSIENTHNMAGGLCWDPDELARVLDVARALDLRCHLDGARLWNAAVATGTTERELALGFDSVAVCLSKGLGAPVGSLLAGSRELMHRAHRVRKMLGGGMRQAGILAAAGIHALHHNRARLVEDHDNAGILARALQEVPGLSVDPTRVHTNIVMVDTVAHDGARLSANALVAGVAEKGVLCHALSDTRLRLVTHLDVDAQACERAAAIIAEVCAGLRGASDDDRSGEP